MNKFLGVIIAMLLVAALSFPQASDGGLKGTVVLPEGSKIPGVLVTLKGIKAGKRITVTSGNGSFLFLSLPPGEYDVILELEGFKTVIRKDLKIEPGENRTLNIQMDTVTLKEEISVTGRAGVIDDLANPETERTIYPYANRAPVYNSGGGIGKYLISKDALEALPAARDIGTILNLIPGVVVDPADSGQHNSVKQLSVGGGGIDPKDTVWHIDGVNITDPSVVGGVPRYFDPHLFEEFQVSTGANDIMARTGGIQVNIVTKSGTASLAGDFHIFAEAFDFDKQPDQKMMVHDLYYPGINRLYQYGINLGGPIIKDKLWWFGSWAAQNVHARTEANIEDNSWLVSGYGKLNFKLGSASGDFHLSSDNKSEKGLAFLSPSQQDVWSLRDLRDCWSLAGLNVDYPLNMPKGNGYINGSFVFTGGRLSLDPLGADINSSSDHNEGNEFIVWDNWSRVAGSSWDERKNRRSLDISLDGNYFLEGALGGDHEIIFGIDYYTAGKDFSIKAPNQRISFLPSNGWPEGVVQIFPDYSIDLSFNRISAYIQDTVTWGKLTASLGVRYDKEQPKLKSFTNPGFSWYEPDSPYHGEEIFPDEFPDFRVEGFKPDSAWEMISPRISLTYDITGDGKNVVKLAAGRYMSQSDYSSAQTYMPNRYGWVYWFDFDNDHTPQYNEIYPDTLLYDPVTGLNDVEFDPDYNTPYLDELTLKFEKALSDDLAVSLTGFYKKKHNLAFDVDSSGKEVPVRRGIMADRSLETKDNWSYTGDIQVAGTDVPSYQQIELPAGWYYYNLDQAYDRYRGLELQVYKRLSNKWMANFSVNLGNWKRFRFEEETLDLNNFDFFNGGVVAPASNSPDLTDLWINSRWQVKLSGLYQLPWGINLTGFFQAKDGNPQPLRRQVFLNQGETFFYQGGKKAGDERLPTFWMLNLGLEKTFPITDRINAAAVVDWYNVTNNRIELKHNLAAGSSAPDETQPTMWTNGGLFQFGVRVNF